MLLIEIGRRRRGFEETKNFDLGKCSFLYFLGFRRNCWVDGMNEFGIRWGGGVGD